MMTSSKNFARGDFSELTKTKPLEQEYNTQILFDKLLELLNREEVEENTLYLVPTPIGNLSDISLRALAILSKVDFIACEDTRNTSKLLQNLSLPKKNLIRCDSNIENKVSKLLVEKIKNGQTVALVSDAGAPLVSDPGHRIVDEVLNNAMKIIALPGASAGLTAILASGLDCSKFYFAGFIPNKNNRLTSLREYLARQETVVFYESPNRLEKLAKELIDLAEKDRRLVIARELSKKFEEYIRITVGEFQQYIEENTIKGEIVVILEGKNSYSKRNTKKLQNKDELSKLSDDNNSFQFIETLIEEGLSSKDIIKKYRESIYYNNEKKSELYDLILNIREEIQENKGG